MCYGNLHFKYVAVCEAIKMYAKEKLEDSFNIALALVIRSFGHSGHSGHSGYLMSKLKNSNVTVCIIVWTGPGEI